MRTMHLIFAFLPVVALENPPTTAPSASEKSALILPSQTSAKFLAAQLSGGRERDPIAFLAMDLSEIRGLLDQLNTRSPTQPKQAQAVANLDELIAMLERQARRAGGSGGGTPMPDSVIAKGPGGSGPMHDPQSGTRAWGQLPPKLREQILQSTNEGFPAGFESILSSYYKRLAQEDVGDAPPNAPASPATQPDSR